MVTAVGNPPGRAVAALICSLNVTTTAGTWFRSILRSAAIVPEEAVTEGTATVNGKHGVDYSVNTQVSNWRVASIAAAQFSTSNRGHGTEDVF